MIKELHTIKIISEYLQNRNIIKQDISSIVDIYDFFLHLEQNKDKFYTLYIYNYFYNFISSDDVSKRKTSARVLEDLLAVIFNAKVADTLVRNNLNFNVSDYFINVKDKIASNRREKADIIFVNNYSISIKTLIAKNIEINMGSFEKKVLFDNLKVDNYLSERKSIDGAGVGSRPQFLKLLKLIDTLSSFEQFKEKFNKMTEFIYSDDLLLAIKNNYKMEFYFFGGDEIVNIFKTHSQNEKDFLQLINRYEGNSLRIDRTALIKNCNKKISLDFSYLQKSVIKLVNQFDYKLHKSYFEYFSNKFVKKELFDDLEFVFNNFDRNFRKLS